MQAGGICPDCVGALIAPCRPSETVYREELTDEVPFNLSTLFQQSTAMAVNDRISALQRSNPMRFPNGLPSAIELRSPQDKATFQRLAKPGTGFSSSFLYSILI